jgi:hypothetical protein
MEIPLDLTRQNSGVRSLTASSGELDLGSHFDPLCSPFPLFYATWFRQADLRLFCRFGVCPFLEIHHE